MAKREIWKQERNRERKAKEKWNLPWRANQTWGQRDQLRYTELKRRWSVNMQTRWLLHPPIQSAKHSSSDSLSNWKSEGFTLFVNYFWIWFSLIEQVNKIANLLSFQASIKPITGQHLHVFSNKVFQVFCFFGKVNSTGRWIWKYKVISWTSRLFIW